MDAIESLLNDYKKKKIDADQLKDQLATILEPQVTSKNDLDRQVTTLQDNYKLPLQTWDGVKTIVADSLDSRASAPTVLITSTLDDTSSNATRVLDDGNQTIVHTIQPNLARPKVARPELTQSDRDNAETIVVHETNATAGTGHETSNRPVTRREHTNNYLDPNRQNLKSVKLKAGSILKNRFILEHELGHGGMSIVYRALDLRKQEANNRNPYIAIKILGEAFKNHPQSIRVLEHETQKIQSLAHPNIITVYDFDRDGDAIYMTMECLDGESLDVLIHDNDAGLAIEKALPIIQAMGRALFYAHSKNIIHSDLKPENVFITKDNTVKVLDFGIARAKKIPEKNASKADKSYVDFDGSNLGALTPSYASPEMFAEADPDPRDDIYALGCVTYKLLTGRHPFNEKQSNHARDDHMVPDKIDELSRTQWNTLSHALAFDREQRIASIADFLDGMVPKKRGLWFYASIVGTCIALVISAYSWYSASQKPALPIIKLSIEQKQKISTYKETADLYFSMGYLASPPGDNAFDQYQKVLEIDPTDQMAIEGKKKIAKQYETLALQKLKTNELEESLLLIKAGLIVEPENKNLLSLQLEIENKQTEK